MIRILLATSNPHKVDEIRAAFAALRTAASPRIELVGLDSFSPKIDEPEEDQPTFEGNAFLKASYYAKQTDHACLADDSGLEVDALGGAPGVKSARYAGAEGPRGVVDPANNALLIKNLAGVPAEDRQARFVCAMAMCLPGRSAPVAVVRGTVEGMILGPDEEPRGENGFGYDPLFYVSDLGKTTAELTREEKSRISHRGEASRRMWEEILRRRETLGVG